MFLVLMPAEGEAARHASGCSAGTSSGALGLGRLGVAAPREKSLRGREWVSWARPGLYGVVGWVVLCNQTTSLFVEPLDQHRRPAPTKVSKLGSGNKIQGSPSTLPRYLLS